MAKMLAIDPAISVRLEAGWSLLVSQAGRQVRRLGPSLGQSIGRLQTVDQVVLPDAAERRALALLVSSSSGLATASIEPQVLAVFDAVEAQLRTDEEES